MPNLQRGEGHASILLTFFMQFCNPGDPKGGPWLNAPPLYTSLLLMHDWKKLLIASHYVNDRTQKLDSRNYAYFANAVLFFQVNLKT